MNATPLGAAFKIEDIVIDMINCGCSESSIIEKFFEVSNKQRPQNGETRYWQIRSINCLLDSFPGREDLLKCLSRLLDNGNSPGHAADVFSSLKTKSNDCDSMLYIVKLLERSQRFYEAESILKDLTTTEPDNQEYLRIAASIYWRQEKFGEALECYQKLHEMHPSDYWAPIMVCHALYKLGRTDDLKSYVITGDSSWKQNAEVENIIANLKSYSSIDFGGDLASQSPVHIRVATAIEEQKFEYAVRFGLMHYSMHMKRLSQIDMRVLDSLIDLHPSITQNIQFFLKRERARLFPESMIAVRDFGKALFARFCFDDARRNLLSLNMADLSVLEIATISQLQINTKKHSEVTPSELFEASQRAREDEIGAYFQIRNTLRRVIKIRGFSLNAAVDSQSFTIPTPYSEHSEYANLINAIITSPPPPPLRSRRLKIALCISGQLRGFRAAIPKTLRAFEEIGEVDTFVHTWEKIGIGVGEHGLMDRILPQEIIKPLPSDLKRIEGFCRTFPRATESLIGDQAIVTREEIIDVTNACAIEIEDEGDFDAYMKNIECPMVNQRKMIYKIHACNELRKTREQKQGFSYDLVVRVRPDLPILRVNDGYISDLINNPNSIGVSYLLNEGIGDQFAIGSSPAITAYSSIWNFVRNHKQAKYLPFAEDIWAERLFLLHTVAMGLDVVPAAVVETDQLVGPTSSRLVAFFCALCKDVQDKDVQPYFYDVVHETAAWIVRAGLISTHEVQSLSALTPQYLGKLYLAMSEQARVTGDDAAAVRLNDNAQKQRATFMGALT